MYVSNWVQSALNRTCIYGSTFYTIYSLIITKLITVKAESAAMPQKGLGFSNMAPKGL